jgi:ACS family sodium-dependent inorganic phosphate cotransporter
VRPQLQGGTSSSAHQPEPNPAVPGSQDDPAAVSNGLKAVSTVSNGNGQTAQQQPVPAVDQLQAAAEQQQAEQLSIQQQQHADAVQQTESSGSSLPAVAQKADTGWYYAVGLSAIAALICSVDRAAISVAILPMSEQYGWSDSTKGAINRCAQQELAQEGSTGCLIPSSCCAVCWTASQLHVHNQLSRHARYFQLGWAGSIDCS